MKTSLVLLLFLPCLVASGGEAGFFRVGCLEGEAAKNLAIASGEFGDIFLEFDTEDQYTYTIEATGRLHPDSAWTTLSSVARHGGRVRCTTTLRWATTLGGSAEDAARCIQQTSDGGYIVAGYTWSFGAGLEDVYLVRTDRNGNEVWPQLFGGSGGDRAHSVQLISDGGCIVAGSTSSFGAEVEDVYVIKTDANGSQFWSPTFGGSSEDRARSVQPTSDGGYIVAGQTSSFGAGESDVWLIKTDPNGTEVWSRTFGGSGRDWANEIQQTSDGGYIVAGWTDSFGVGQDDLYLIKTDRYGYAPFP